MIIIALPVLMYCASAAKPSPASITLRIETATAAPSSSKTIDTVVDVGRPKVLNRSSRMTSVNMTARKMVSNSGMVKNCGWKIPFLATSIMPLENVTPARMPRLAMIMIT